MLKTVLAACVVLFAMTLHADARPRHHVQHQVIVADPGCNVLWPCEGVTVSRRGERVVKSMGGFGSAQKVYHPRHGGQSSIGWSGGNLVAQARAYIGTNPTGWRHLWCGRFLAMIAPSVAAKVRNPNLAKAYLALPRTSGNVGDIAVLGRRGGGHVGIVSGFDSQGNPIIVSGNAGGGIVREGVYARSRVLAFVSAG